MEIYVFGGGKGVGVDEVNELYWNMKKAGGFFFFFWGGDQEGDGVILQYEKEGGEIVDMCVCGGKGGGGQGGD